MIRVLVVRPGAAPTEEEIEPTNTEIQRLVCGWFKFYRLDEQTALFCNEERVRLDLQPCRSLVIRGKKQTILGPFVLFGSVAERTCSLTPEQIERWQAVLSAPAALPPSKAGLHA